MSQPFPFGSVNRAIEAEVGEGPTADALRDLAAAASRAVPPSRIVTIVPSPSGPAVTDVVCDPYSMNVYVAQMTSNDRGGFRCPAAPADGDTFTVKCVGGSGGLNGVVVDGNGHSIDNHGTYTMGGQFNNVFMAATFSYDDDLGVWLIIWSYPGTRNLPP